MVFNGHCLGLMSGVTRYDSTVYVLYVSSEKEYGL